MTEPKKIMPRPEVKRLLNIKSDFTLANMRVEGRGPRYFKTGKMVQYLEEDVWEYILANRRQSTSENPPALVKVTKPRKRVLTPRQPEATV